MVRPILSHLVLCLSSDSSLFSLSSLHGRTEIGEIHRYVNELVRQIEQETIQGQSSHLQLRPRGLFFSRSQGETGPNDCLMSLNVLCYILLTMSKLMAPFTPFLAEYMYQILRKLMPPSSSSSSSSAEQDLSVHFQMIPQAQFVRSQTSRRHVTSLRSENRWFTKMSNGPWHLFKRSSVWVVSFENEKSFR